AGRAGEPVARDTLTDEGELEGSARAIDVLITRLRRKVEPDPRDPRYLQTVRGKGYALMPD
ncbi:MAG: helix-turn-helix domain-containing protein, partial [Rhodospirillaceae bacterium]|nr:helix-turn-helix domain-containing protein [Rhodospirillaceae bacterium]